MKNLVGFLVILFIILSCNSEKNTKAENKKPKAAESTAAATSNTDVRQLFLDKLQISDQVEIMIEINGVSMTSESQNKAQIMAYANYISDIPAPKYDCLFEGSLVFRRGDEFIMAVDCVFSPECAHMQLDIDGKKYDHKMSQAGTGYFSQFTRMMLQQGQ